MIHTASSSPYAQSETMLELTKNPPQCISWNLIVFCLPSRSLGWSSLVACIRVWNQNLTRTGKIPAQLHHVPAQYTILCPTVQKYQSCKDFCCVMKLYLDHPVSLQCRMVFLNGLGSSVFSWWSKVMELQNSFCYKLLTSQTQYAIWERETIKAIEESVPPCFPFILFSSRHWYSSHELLDISFSL